MQQLKISFLAHEFYYMITIPKTLPQGPNYLMQIVLILLASQKTFKLLCVKIYMVSSLKLRKSKGLDYHQILDENANKRHQALFRMWTFMTFSL